MAAAALLGGSAAASTVISSESGTGRPYQQWVDAARVPTPDITLTVVDAGCPEYPTHSCARAETATVWINPSTRWPRRTFFHELGHQFDAYEMTDDGRAAFSGIYHDDRSWAAEPNPPLEKFAEGYSICAVQARPRRPQTFWNWGYWRGLAKHRAVCRLIRAAGAA